MCLRAVHACPLTGRLWLPSRFQAGSQTGSQAGSQAFSTPEFVVELHKRTPFKIFPSMARFDKESAHLVREVDLAESREEASVKNMTEYIGVKAECFITAVRMEDGKIMFNVFRRSGGEPKPCSTIEEISSQFSSHFDAAGDQDDAGPVYQAEGGCEPLRRLVEDKDLLAPPLQYDSATRAAISRNVKQLKTASKKQQIMNMVEWVCGLEQTMNNEKDDDANLEYSRKQKEGEEEDDANLACG